MKTLNKFICEKLKINSKSKFVKTSLKDINSGIHKYNVNEIIEILEKNPTYNVSIVLMTDGMPNIGSFRNLKQSYEMTDKDVPMYSITFGSADEYKLEEIAKLTNGKVFDGKSDLVKAFKAVRGYN